MKKLFVILILSGVFFSCHKELEPEIYDSISPTTFPKTQDDVSASVTALYSNIGIEGRGYLFTLAVDGVTIWPELSTDIMTCEWGAFWIPLTNFGWNAGNIVEGLNNTICKYDQISAAELTLDRIKDVEMDESLKNRYVAEIKCLQGWIAWMLYDLFGPIPVASLEVLKNPLNEVILERPTKEWMVNYISSRIREAADILPAEYEANDWGRVTKGTALMVLLKLYMHEKDWINAEKIAREIIALNIYELLPDYASVFTKDNQRNKEIIYAVPATIENGNRWMTNVLPGNYTTENKSIMKWGGFRMRWSFFNTYEPNDERLDVIASDYVGTDGVRYNQDNPGSYLVRGPLPIKYGEDPEQIGYRSLIDQIVFRYSDVLLSLAEAIANKSVPNQESIDFVNMVRNRVGLENVKLANYANLNDFNDMILLERGHELFVEGGRRQDQIRHNTYISFGKTIIGSQAEDHKVLFPLPQWFIDEGKGSIAQNPGY